MTIRQIKARIEALEKKRVEMLERHASPVEIHPVTLRLAYLYKALSEAEGLSR